MATADFDGDGWIDVFVANDQQENQLWLNRGGERFEDVGLMSGTALGATGALKADMGVDAGDFDNDGDEDLFMTDLTTQGSTFYVNDGSARFEEQSARAGIRVVSLPYTGFGAGWFDYDNDGWLDLLAVNGLVTQNLDALGPDNPFPLQQPNQLLRNLGDGRFADVTAQAGPALALSEVSRGAAFGDIDNDGDTDVVIANAEGPVRLLINEIADDRSWLGLRLVGDPPRRAAPRRRRRRSGRGPGHAGGAGGDRAGRRHHTVAPGAGGRELRLRERPAGARGSRRRCRPAGARPRHLAERCRRGVERRARRALHDARRGQRQFPVAAARHHPALSPGSAARPCRAASRDSDWCSGRARPSGPPGRTDGRASDYSPSESFFVSQPDGAGRLDFGNTSRRAVEPVHSLVAIRVERTRTARSRSGPGRSPG